MSHDFAHVSVLLDEVLALTSGWEDRPVQLVDCTLGGGGHAAALLSRLPHASLLAVDRDPRAIAAGQERLAGFGARAVVRRARFADVAAVAAAEGVPPADMVIADLGVSSPQLDVAGRGFSLSAPGPLDMRMDQSDAAATTAADCVNTWSEEELAEVFRRLGDEPRAARVAGAIVRERERAQERARAPFHRAPGTVDGATGDDEDTLAALPRTSFSFRGTPVPNPILSTAHLRRVVEGVLDAGPRRRAAGTAGDPGPRRRVHPARRVFQALRIAVNDELGQVAALGASLPALLRPGGVACFIAFHSLEAEVAAAALRIAGLDLVVNGLPPSEAEVARNPRARSATMWVGQRDSGTGDEGRTPARARRRRRARPRE